VCPEADSSHQVASTVTMSNRGRMGWHPDGCGFSARAGMLWGGGAMAARSTCHLPAAGAAKYLCGNLEGCCRLDAAKGENKGCLLGHID
jgi:hypothetical protein